MGRVRGFAKRILLNLAAVGIGLALAFLVGELLLAWLVPPPLVYSYPQPLHRADARLGWVLIPNQHSFTIDKPVVTNSLGFRSPELPPRKNPQGMRIMCLGDSQTFGNGVAQDETYPARLESLLASGRKDGPVEVINAGVQVYSTEQEVDQMEEFAPQLEPDVVTIGFYINDIGEVLRQDKTKMIDSATGEFARVEGLKRFTPYRLIYFLKRSRLVTFVQWRIMLLSQGGNSNPETGILLGTPPPQYERSWRIIEQALLRARSFALAHGIRLIAFAVPDPQEFAKSYPREQYRSRFLDVAHRLGIETIDPAPAIRAAGAGAGRFFIPWDGHMSDEGHALIAELLARQISVPVPSASAVSGGPPGGR